LAITLCHTVANASQLKLNLVPFASIGNPRVE